MDNRTMRGSFADSSSRNDIDGAQTSENRAQARPQLPTAFHSMAQSVNSPHDATKFPNTSLFPPYGRNIQGLLFDPVLYSSMQRPYLIPRMHPGLQLQSGYRPALTGLNQINPVLLLSSNDNNNCNSRSRAASHSSVLEMHQSGALGLHYPIASNAHYPYYLRKFQSNLVNESASFRRNSTNTSLPQEGASSTSHRPLGVGNAPPHYERPPPPYPTVTDADGVARNNMYHQMIANHTAARRDRYSVGVPFSSIAPVARNFAMLRRNSTPTSLEVQHISEESTENSSSVDDDDDDVFEASPPVNAPHSATDAASFLEQLRETRKRAATCGGTPLNPKYPCPADQLRRPRFRRCDADNAEERAPQISEGPHETETRRDDIPGTSRCTESSANPKPSETPSKSVAIEESNHNKLKVTDTATRKKMTPSPSILKNPKLKKAASSQNEADSASVLTGQSSTNPEGLRVKSLPLKKQVAWKDDTKFNDPRDELSPRPIKPGFSQDRLDRIVKCPADYTEKRRMGPFIFGPKLDSSPVKSITQYLVRKEGTFKYYLAKVFLMGGRTDDDRSGRLLLYSEHSLLTLLKNHPGVVREHGLYKDVAFDGATGEARERVCLVLDCLTPHEFDPATRDCLVLQKHVMRAGHLAERETVRIFTLILDIVHSLHELNVVHRDLKLENMVLLEKSQKVILTNFCLGRHLMSDDDLLKDRRGSPAYISPDVLSGKPYAGKPSDMWSLGVVLFMMLYGQFPFYDKDPMQLFKKIRKADFVIPSNSTTSTQVNDIIRGLLTFDPAARLTSGETLQALKRCVSARSLHRYSPNEVQVVPDIDNEKESSSDSEDEKKDDEEQQQYLEERLTREFRLKLLSDDEDATPSQNRTKAFARSSYQSALPTMQHCPYDARPLTQEEIAMHRRLLVNSTLGVRTQNST